MDRLHKGTRVERIEKIQENRQGTYGVIMPTHGRTTRKAGEHAAKSMGEGTGLCVYPGERGNSHGTHGSLECTRERLA